MDDSEETTAMSDDQKQYESLKNRIKSHEQNSYKWHKDVMAKLDKHKGDTNMGIHEEISTVGRGGYGGFDGSGGILGAILALSLINRRGFSDDCNGHGHRDVELQNSINTNAIMDGIADIKQAVPEAEGNLQLAMANNLAAVIADLNGANIANLQGQAAINANLCSQTQHLSNQLCQLSAQNDRNTFALSQTTHDEAEKTRALIQSIDKANDSRLITAQANEIIELRSERNRDRDRHGVEITMVNNQNQNQLQMQQQQQAIANLVNCMHGLTQNIRDTNTAINIGGLQSANPTNTNSNTSVR